MQPGYYGEIRKSLSLNTRHEPEVSPPEERLVRIRWWILEVHHLYEALIFVVLEHLVDVGVHPPSGVEEHLRHPEGAEQFQPLHQREGEVFLVIEQGGGANSNLPVRGASVSWAGS